jgi:hypothetical protein
VPERPRAPVDALGARQAFLARAEVAEMKGGTRRQACAGWLMLSTDKLVKSSSTV